MTSGWVGISSAYRPDRSPNRQAGLSLIAMSRPPLRYSRKSLILAHDLDFVSEVLKPERSLLPNVPVDGPVIPYDLASLRTKPIIEENDVHRLPPRAGYD
jgi:hypothetical protein